LNLSILNLPSPEGFIESPFWDGHNFLIGNSSFPVLEYSENFSGWSDDLTLLHESSVGDFHPLDIASRLYAVSQVAQCKPTRNTIIVEIGCSSGFLLRDLIECFPLSTIVGVDVVKEPLFKLSKTLPGVPLIRFDLLKCPLPKDCVDVLIMLNVLEHIEDDLKEGSSKGTISIILLATSSIDLLNNKITGRRTNPLDQKQFYPNDLSMDRVFLIANSNFNFGAPR